MVLWQLRTVPLIAVCPWASNWTDIINPYNFKRPELFLSLIANKETETGSMPSIVLCFL